MSDRPFRTIIEPFRINSDRADPADDRGRAARRHLAAVDHNLFHLLASDVPIDLLTDSGTGRDVRGQWAAIRAATSRTPARRPSTDLRGARARLVRFPHVIPTHQGRAAERILFTAAGGPGQLVPGNTHFDTTRAHIEYAGAAAVDLSPRCP